MDVRRVSRAAVTSTAVQQAEARRDGRLWWDPAAAAAFDSPSELLLALYDRWQRRLLARVDEALGRGYDPTEAVAALLRATPGQVALFARNRHLPALAAARRHTTALLALASVPPAALAALTAPAAPAVAAPHGRPRAAQMAA